MENGFENCLLIALDIIDHSEDKSEAKHKILRLLDAYRERKYSMTLSQIKKELGIWNIC